jgi:hypothetical protein
MCYYGIYLIHRFGPSSNVFEDTKASNEGFRNEQELGIPAQEKDKKVRLPHQRHHSKITMAVATRGTEGGYADSACLSPSSDESQMPAQHRSRL